jgi:hypothetical protein
MHCACGLPPLPRADTNSLVGAAAGSRLRLVPTNNAPGRNEYDDAPPIPAPCRVRTRDAGAARTRMGAELAGQAHPGDDSVLGRQFPRHRRTHRARSALEPTGPAYRENRGGAGGTIGSAMVAKADPDGYTILINASAHSAAPAAYPNVTYDPARDFSAVIPFGTIPNVTVISPAKASRQSGSSSPPPNRAPSPTPPPAWAAPLIGPRSVCA